MSDTMPDTMADTIPDTIEHVPNPSAARNEGAWKPRDHNRPRTARRQARRLAFLADFEATGRLRPVMERFGAKWKTVCGMMRNPYFHDEFFRINAWVRARNRKHTRLRNADWSRARAAAAGMDGVVARRLYLEIRAKRDAAQAERSARELATKRKGRGVLAGTRWAHLIPPIETGHEKAPAQEVGPAPALGEADGGYSPGSASDVTVTPSNDPPKSSAS